MRIIVAIMRDRRIINSSTNEAERINMSIYIQTRLNNFGGTILFVELEDGSLFIESDPIFGCDAILQEGARISKIISEYE